MALGTKKVGPVRAKRPKEEESVTPGQEAAGEPGSGFL